MKNTFGYLGKLENVNLDNLRYKKDNGYYELDNPNYYRSINNYPDDLHIINRLTTDIDSINRQIFGFEKSSTRLTQEYASYVGDMIKRFEPARKHLTGIEMILTGVLEIHVSEEEDFCMQRFYRYPDEMVFIRVYERSSWSEWTYENNESLFLYNVAQDKLFMSEKYLDDMIANLAPRFDDAPVRAEAAKKVIQSEYDSKVKRVNPDVRGTFRHREHELFSHDDVVLTEPASMWGLNPNKRLVLQNADYMWLSSLDHSQIHFANSKHLHHCIILQRPGNWSSPIMTERDFVWKHVGAGKSVMCHDIHNYSEIGILLSGHGWRNMITLPIGVAYAFRPMAWFHLHTDPTITYNGAGHVTSNHYAFDMFVR